MRFIYLLILFFCAQLFAGEPNMPPANFAEGWVKKDQEITFTADDLYGHINGGAELFLEMGFQKLTVQNYTNGKNELSLEVYEMDSSLSALGIYLQKCGKEKAENVVQARNTMNVFQLLALKNKYYIQVNNFSGDSAYAEAMIKLANGFLSDVRSYEFDDAFSILPKNGRIEGSERIIRGPYSLQRIYTFGDGDMLNLGGQIFAFMAKYKIDDEIYTQIYAAYSDPDEARMVLLKIRNNLDSYLEAVSEKEDRFTFKDYKDQFGIVAHLNNSIIIKTGLSQISEK